MFNLLLLTVLSAFASESVVLRAPHAELSVYNDYLKANGKKAFSQAFAERLQSTELDTTAMDRCLEALAFTPNEKNEICFSSVQTLKKQLWTTPLKRVLVPFFERLVSENLSHKKLYAALHVGLTASSSKQMNGELDLAFRERRVFQQWLAKQSEWQDAKIYVNGTLLSEINRLPTKQIAQWFLISNAGRTLSHIGTQSDFQKYLVSMESFRFLNCQSISAVPLELDSIGIAEYFESPSCIVELKKEKSVAPDSVYARWQKSQSSNFTTSTKLEKPSQLPKWTVPVLVGLVIGTQVLKGKKVSVRMPEL